MKSGVPMPRWVRKLKSQAFCAVGTFFLSGCAQDSAYSEYWQLLQQNTSGLFGDKGVTREQAAAIPYASMGYRVDGGQERLLVLATDDSGALTWTSASHVVLVTRMGRLFRTVNLTHDLGGLTAQSGSDLPPISAALKASFSYSKLADYPDLAAYGVLITCTATAKGRETITILGQPIVTVRVDEVCGSKFSNWEYIDSYWLDPDGSQTWRSVQHPNPKLGALELETFRAPS